MNHLAIFLCLSLAFASQIHFETAKINTGGAVFTPFYTDAAAAEQESQWIIYGNSERVSVATFGDALIERQASFTSEEAESHSGEMVLHYYPSEYAMSGTGGAMNVPISDPYFAVTSPDRVAWHNAQDGTTLLRVLRADAAPANVGDSLVEDIDLAGQCDAGAWAVYVPRNETDVTAFVLCPLAVALKQVAVKTDGSFVATDVTPGGALAGFALRDSGMGLAQAIAAAADPTAEVEGLVLKGTVGTFDANIYSSPTPINVINLAADADSTFGIVVWRPRSATNKIGGTAITMKQLYHGLEVVYARAAAEDWPAAGEAFSVLTGVDTTADLAARLSPFVAGAGGHPAYAADWAETFAAGINNVVVRDAKLLTYIPAGRIGGASRLVEIDLADPLFPARALTLPSVQAPSTGRVELATPGALCYPAGPLRVLCSRPMEVSDSGSDVVFVAATTRALALAGLPGALTTQSTAADVVAIGLVNTDVNAVTGVSLVEGGTELTSSMNGISWGSTAGSRVLAPGAGPLPAGRPATILPGTREIVTAAVDGGLVVNVAHVRESIPKNDMAAVLVSVIILCLLVLWALCCVLAGPVAALRPLSPMHWACCRCKKKSEEAEAESEAEETATPAPVAPAPAPISVPAPAPAPAPEPTPMPAPAAPAGNTPATDSIAESDVSSQISTAPAEPATTSTTAAPAEPATEDDISSALSASTLDSGF